MNQQTFENWNEQRWNQIDQLLRDLDKRRVTPEAAQLPSLYRQLCADISLAQHRMYGARLCTELNDRLIRCRQALGRQQDGKGRGFARLMVEDFPRAIRREARLFWLGMLLFFGPMILMVAASHLQPQWLFSVLGPEEMRMIDGMWGKGASAQEFARDEFGSDFGMFGFYVWNNISIGLNIAGSGLLAMVGAMFQLAYQGTVLGAMQGYVHYAGDMDRFYAFVAGHAAFELVGFVVCGLAGMRLGQAILKPGMRTRGAALAEAGRKAAPLICGGALLILFAAFIEGFWSAGPAPAQVKHAVGIGNAVVLTLYFLFCGRKGETHEA